MPAKELVRLTLGETGEACCLDPCGGAVSRFDGFDQTVGKNRSETEPDVNCREKTVLDLFVIGPDHRFEGRDHVANDVFRRIMQEGREEIGIVEAGIRSAGAGFDQQGMLGDGKDRRATRLAVPAGDAGEAVGDIFDLDIERRRIEQIKTPTGEHALPCAGWLLLARHQRRRSSVLTSS